jgi:two-component system OmpR family response regulator
MRLLLVEDDRLLADELQTVLKASGYAVDRATDGENALYLGQSEDYDLVVLDLGLPGLGGIHVLYPL